MRKHGWIITEVNTDCLEQSEVGIMGPRDMNVTKEELLNQGQKFTMYDDDGEHYYTGYVIGFELAPLDDFGMPNAGCTMLKINGELI